MTKQLILRPEKCVDCRTCELVCSYHHHQQFNPTLSAIKVVDFPEDVLTVPFMCLHCDEPACVDACPVEALTKQADGTVLYNPEDCTLCQSCVEACPTGGITYSAKADCILKCDLCSGNPQCVEWCAPKAIDYLDSDDDNVGYKAIAEKFKELMLEGVA
ncbi:MAG: 4Fe-4S dicluster domain-containing protein [Coriobacteriia bacterium]|nr:4Fe-4S dicluster domain-containing protein [Coriobacteriia bacterium]